EVYAPRVAVVARRHAPNTVLRRYEASAPSEQSAAAATAVVERPAHPVEINRSWRERIQVAAGWWAVNGRNHAQYPAPGQFQAAPNQSAGIPRQARDHASAARLERAYFWMQSRVREHARATGITIPDWAADDE